MKYYKKINSNSTLALKNDISEYYEIDKDNYTELTESEYNALKTRPQRTQEQIAKANIRKQIILLKKKLADTDYQAIKYAEGLITESEYSTIKAQRQEWRNQINNLESQL